MAEEEGTGEEEGTEEKTEDKEEEKKGPATIEEALAKAREVLADKGTMMAMVEESEDKEDADGEEEAGGEEDEEKEEGEEEGEQESEDKEDEEDRGSDADDETDDVEGEEEKEEEEEEEKKPITVSVPGRHPNSEDIELEVEDEEIAERLAHLKSGFLRGEEVRERELAMTASEDAMAALSEEFAVDPAGFVMQYTENKEELGNVALALLTVPEVWDAISGQVDKLFSDTGELRTLRAEIKANRLEAKDRLQKRAVLRKENAASGKKLGEAIDLMVPESIDGTKREQLITDLTRDTTDHITRNKLEKLDVKDLVTILAGRLETNGIDPLEARKAIQDGSRSRGKITTKKKRPEKKPKTGKELATASAKRKKVAAAPGPGKRAAPTQPTKLPAGMTIKESIELARKKGLAAFLPDK